ncbi:DUF4825 domain-containing protein [Peribacillus alkalitolerans]|uniref:DUF4825 domain-containing protein n=1 Tax=Peribacillus alkalitolerans TaxID=1550385 RepID=UPI0013CFFAF7|nr:DUF4825 domain-containing protein [Peribacillus alkalitolerans]
MKKITMHFIILMFLLLSLTSCRIDKDSSKDIFQYKESYIGNNSAVGGIIDQLPHSKEFKQMTLQTKKKPYGMVIEYNNSAGDTKSIAINNATFLFALVKNLDWITFGFPDEKYTLERDQLQQWYGKDLSDYTNEKDLKNLIQTNLKDKTKVNQLFI